MHWLVYMVAWLLLVTSRSAQCPAECRCLDHDSVVNCHHASVDRLPAPLPRAAIVIDADRNRISGLYNDSLVGGESLEIVSLQDNLLIHIEPGVFSRYPALRIVRLGGNRLSSLPAALFTSCRRLQVLDVHGNRLTGAPPDNLFYHVHALLSLNVSNNRLSSAQLGPGFRYVTQLADLDLSGNDVRVVEADTFSVTRFWDERVERRLLMTSCNLRQVDKMAFRLLPGLRSLSLANNSLLSHTELITAVQQLNSLRKLDISSGSAFRPTFDLADLFQPDAAEGLHLEELVAAGNGIQAVGGNLSSAVTSLRVLDLSNNEFKTLDDDLALFRRLERLSVSGNRVRTIEAEALAGLDRLTTLDVSFNELEQLNVGALRSASRLRHLNLAGNRLHTVSADSLPSQLEFFSVRDNRLTEDRFLAKLTRLRVVDVSGNQLANLGAHVLSSGLTSTISANFSYNEISSIDPRAFADVAFNVLDLAGKLLKLTKLLLCFLLLLGSRVVLVVTWSQLDLAGNRLTELSLNGARAVDVLRADNNLIIDVDDNVFQTTRDLHLADNRLQTLRTRCGDALVSLSTSPEEEEISLAEFSNSTRSQTLVLDVSDNPDLGPVLESQGCTSLAGLDELQVLRARHVGFRRIPLGLVGRLASLRVLDLTGNQIRSIPEHVDDDVAAAWRRIHELNVAENLLVDLRALAQSLSWSNAEGEVFVKAADNPWRCRCTDVQACRQLVDVLPTLHLPHHPDPICASPELRSGRPVLGFCQELLAADAKNQTAFRCVQISSDVIGRQQEDSRTVLRTLTIVVIGFVTLAVPLLLVCTRVCRYHREQRHRSHRSSGTMRRNGYQMVGETAMDSSDALNI